MPRAPSVPTAVAIAILAAAHPDNLAIAWQSALAVADTAELSRSWPPEQQTQALKGIISDFQLAALFDAGR